ncbi:MAG: hypothetical protein SVV03_01210 [Candidatus Nanohaloarchaea archaeon]|nr:hypothetical protein [Candidatus Nanohaloarchaea archaeon]
MNNYSEDSENREIPPLPENYQSNLDNKVHIVDLYLRSIDLPKRFETERNYQTPEGEFTESQKIGIFIKDQKTDREIAVEEHRNDKVGTDSRLSVREYMPNGYPREVHESYSPKEVARAVIGSIEGATIPEMLEE